MYGGPQHYPHAHTDYPTSDSRLIYILSFWVPAYDSRTINGSMDVYSIHRNIYLGLFKNARESNPLIHHPFSHQNNNCRGAPLFLDTPITVLMGFILGDSLWPLIGSPLYVTVSVDPPSRQPSVNPP